MKKKNRIFGKVLMVLMIAFFYMPILYMIVFSFNDGKSLTSFSGFPCVGIGTCWSRRI